MPWTNPASYPFTHLGVTLNAPSQSGVYAIYTVKRLRVSAHKLRHTSNVLSRVAGIDPFTRSKMRHYLGEPEQ